MKTKKTIKIFRLFIAILTLTALFHTNAIAVNSYYTENNYEKTNAYASVDENNNSINMSKNNSKIIQNGNTKKIYTTIIVKSKKNKKPTPMPAPIIIEKEQKKKEQIPEVTVKPVNKKHYDDDFFSSKKKSSSSILEKLFQKKTPDDFYVYALSGYSASLSNTIKINATNSLNNAIDDNFPTLSSSAPKKGVGFNFIVGTKIYLNKNKFALFVAPELFYNKLKNANNSKFDYNSQHFGLIDPMGQDQPKEVSVKIPANMSIKTKDMYGGTIRLGLTMLNTVSLFGKVSLGGARYGINSSLDINNTDWSSANITDPNIKQKIVNEQWCDQSSKYYINTKNGSSLSKTILTYGLGFGIEFSFFNQHLTVRADQDWWYGSGLFSNGKSFSLKPNEKTTFKIRNKFSTTKITIGLAF